MALTDIDTRVLKTCCDLNDMLTLTVRENDRLYVYKSRFLSVDFSNKFVIIDEPSPETQNAKPISKGQTFQIFFEFKIFRYYIDALLKEHVMYKLSNKSFHAAKIPLPSSLKDGDKREYFRVETSKKPNAVIRFTIYKKGSDSPLMLPILTNVCEEFQGEIEDISAGGFSLRTKTGEPPFPLEKGDTLHVHLRLKTISEKMEIWSEVRNVRKYKGTNITIWGIQFMGKEKNPNINAYRNKIMHYVAERQREMLLK